MELHLETVALFSLKLAYESEDSSPILRDDLVMGDYQRDVFELLVRRGDVEAIQAKVDECVGLALEAGGGVAKPVGRELGPLAEGAARRQLLGPTGASRVSLNVYLIHLLLIHVSSTPI